MFQGGGFFFWLNTASQQAVQQPQPVTVAVALSDASRTHSGCDSNVTTVIATVLLF